MWSSAASGNPYRVEVQDFLNDATGTYRLYLQRLTSGVACEGVQLVCGITRRGAIENQMDSSLHSVVIEMRAYITIGQVTGEDFLPHGDCSAGLVSRLQVAEGLRPAQAAIVVLRLRAETRTRGSAGFFERRQGDTVSMSRFSSCGCRGVVGTPRSSDGFHRHQELHIEGRGVASTTRN